MEKDLFDIIEQSREQLQERAKEIFYICSEYKFHTFSHGNTITNISIDPYYTAIESQAYWGGVLEDYYCDFPSSLLLQTDDEVHEYFRLEQEKLDEKKRLEKKHEEERLHREFENRERAELDRLLKKYGKGE